MLEKEEKVEALSRNELIQLSAVDTNFFARTFFPKTMRQGSPAFHQEMDKVLEGDDRLVSIQVYRGGAKTTKLRVFGAKRIAFGISHTILWVGKSQEHAIHSVNWLKKQIQFNRLFAETFELRRGEKWQDVEIEIIHGIEEFPIRVLAFGITGSVRGVNIDDYRPDLIILDDILDEENSATPIQREKTEKLVYGALMESLAPRSEAPDAKMVLLQTPHNIEDLSVKSLSPASGWKSARFGCWTPETEDLPLEQRESAWEERTPAAELRKEKREAIARNQLSTFSREKECKIITSESASFKADWLQYYDLTPEEPFCIMAIDPVPPPSEVEISKGLKGKDSECLAVVGLRGKDYFLLDYSVYTGHDPEWTISEFFRLATKWRVKRVVVESIAYQRTLAWLLKKAMDSQRKYFPIVEYVDKRKKYSRILDALSGIAANGRLYVRPEMSDFIQQFTEYPYVAHDDVLDAVSIAVSELNFGADLESFEEILEQEKREMAKLSYQRGAP